MAEANLDNIAEDLFFKLRNRFPRIRMSDENGQTTTNPMQGRFFNFKFEANGKNLGLITCSLIDGQSLKVYFSQDMTSKMNDAAQDKWFDLLQELRKFAMTKPALKSIDIRDIDKDQLDQKDVNFVSKYHKEKNTVQESKINWERHGRFSEGNHKSIKIHVVHKNKLEENPNNRLLAIDKIYLVNENKERFLLPFVSIVGAKAMAQHVARGGTPYDTDGQTIGKAVTEMKNLSRFATSLRNKTFESDEPLKVVRASKHVKEQIKRSLNRMAGTRNFEEGMEGLRSLLAAESTDKTEVLKDWFTQTTYDDKIDTWLESATNALRRCMEQNVNLSEEDDSALDIKDYTAKRAANPAQIGSSLELYANPDKDDEMRALIKSQPMRGMIRLILADISTRAVDDETAILASKADEGEFNLKHKKMIEAYLRDLYTDNPPRKEPEAKKDLYGKKKKSPEDEFEEEIMRMGEDECPHCGMSPCHCEDHDHSMKEEGDEEEMEAIGDRHKHERFKSLKKIKSRFKAEEVGNESMEAGVCNHTMEGEMCPVHGMEECSGMGGDSVTLAIGEEEHTMEDIVNLRRLAGMAEAKKPDEDGDGVPDWADKKPGEDDNADKGEKKDGMSDKQAKYFGKKKANEEISWMRRLAGLQENYIYADEEEELPEPPADDAAATDVSAVDAPATDAPATDDAAAKFNIDDWEKVQALTDHYLEKGAKEEEAQETAAQDLGFDPAMVTAWAEKNSPEGEKDYGTSDDEGEEISKFGEEMKVADEGNEFSGELAKAKASHKDEFEVGGKKYKVKEDKKPDEDGDGVPDWADKKPGKDDNDKKKTDEALENLKKAAGIW